MDSNDIRMFCILFYVSLFVPAIRASIISEKYPSNEYEYSLRRDKLLETEEKMEGRKDSLTGKEKTVDHYLQYLKWREFKATKNNGFPPSRPIEEKLDYIQTTEIYQALLKFPKGGNMRSHEGHDISKRILFDIVWSIPDFQHLYMLPPDHPTAPWTLDFFITPPVDNPPWINVKESIELYPKDEILKHHTLIGLLSSNESRYATVSKFRYKALLNIGKTALTDHIDVKKKYLETIYEVQLSQGVIYIETRQNFGLFARIYELDSDPQYNSTNGKKYLDQGGDLDVQIALEVSKNFSQLHPEWVGHKRISFIFRQVPFDVFEYEMNNTVRLNKLYPDHVLGLDAVGEEDAGYSHLHYLSEFLKLYRGSTGQSSIPLYLHTAETNWPGDLIASDLEDDFVATLQNVYEMMLLNSKRIGHGNGFTKHPYLLQLIKDRDIPIETCVVSNQILGFGPDIRNHPALHNFRYGVPIILGSNAAGLLGYDNFTVDWYETFMAWGLDLRDLKTLAINSLKYSGLSDAHKKDAIDSKWKPLWNKYIDDIYSVACARDYIGEATRENRTVTVAGILPTAGAKIRSTKVHLFGRNFERAICQNVACKFGDTLSPSATYISNQHIICESPVNRDHKVRTVEMFLSGNGVIFVPTGHHFTYLYD